MRDANNLKTFKTRALARTDVRREYDALAEEFELLDEILKARVAAGLTQAEVAARIGTTQSVVHGSNPTSGSIRLLSQRSSVTRRLWATGCSYDSLKIRV